MGFWGAEARWLEGGGSVWSSGRHSFVAGLVSASFFWISIAAAFAMLPASPDADGDGTAVETSQEESGDVSVTGGDETFTMAQNAATAARKFDQDEQRSGKVSFIRSLSSRIGELPSRSMGKVAGRMRWPWDRIRESSHEIATSGESEGDGTKPPTDSASRKIVRNDSEGESSTSSSSSSHLPRDEKSGLCIGSIFGLDVGGTLAKLVYFEQESTERRIQEEERGHRTEHYHQAALARAVLEARRGSTLADHLENNMTNFTSQYKAEIFGNSSSSSSSPSNKNIHSAKSNEDLKRMFQVRQASLPDNLNEFASSCNIQTTEVRSINSLRNVILGDDGDLVTQLQTSPSDEGETSADACGAGQNSTSAVSKRGSSEPAPASLYPSAASGGGMKRSQSMFDISKSRDHAEALDRFYNFARRLDTYETGVKDKHLSFYSRELGGEFHFIRFETRHMESAMELIRINNLHLNIVEMGAAGGGAHKYAADWERVLGIRMVKQDELDSLVAGMQFVLTDVVGECYTFQPQLTEEQKQLWENVGHHERSTESNARSCSLAHEGGPGIEDRDKIPLAPHDSTSHSTASPPNIDESDGTSSSSASTEDVGRPAAPLNGTDECNQQTEHGTPNRSPRNDERTWSKVQRNIVTSSAAYPYLLVTIGTGVSVLRVDGPRKHERISGSTIGGGTYWGLCRLLTDVEDFEDVLNLSERGDASKVDMMVGDIYGKGSDALEKLGLPSDIVASSFGKLVAKQHPAAGLKQEDLARALLLMVTNNIGQVAYLNAQLHKTPRIFFVGNFLRHNIISQQRLAYAIKYWSSGKMEALFLQHEGYFGALGAFLLSQGISVGSGPADPGGKGSSREGKLSDSSSHRRRARTMSH